MLQSDNAVRRGTWVSVPLCVVLFGAVAYGGEPVKKHATAPAPSRVALNQAVEIERPSADVRQAEEVRTDPESTDSAQENPRQGEVLRAMADTRMTRRTRRADNVFERESTSWYDSGLGPLLIVLVVIAVAAWALRKWVPAARKHDNGVIKVMARTNVTPKHSVALLRVGRRMILVGACGDRINTLCEMSEAQEVAELEARAEGGRGYGAGGFDGLLGRESAVYTELSPPEPAEKRAAEREATTPEPVNRLLRKLRAMKTS